MKLSVSAFHDRDESSALTKIETLLGASCLAIVLSNSAVDGVHSFARRIFNKKLPNDRIRKKHSLT